jgi:spore maturation protein CgeB
VKILAVEPGPAFSVADVHHGLVKGLRQNGCDVLSLNYGARLDWYSQVAVNRDGEWCQAAPGEDAIRLASKGIEAAAFEWWPDVVIFTSCFFIPAFTMDLLRARGMKVVNWFTESPYEDDGQLMRAPHADLNIVNDPIHLDRYRQVGPAAHIGHAYDPDVHHPQPSKPELASDFCFVGTGFPSRVAFLEQVDWTGIDVALAGMWLRLPKDSPLRKFVAHDIDECVGNDQAAELYASTKVSANLYRKEAERADLEEGWAVGPREIELAACGVPFVREARGEGDRLFPMLPTFTDPDEFGEQVRWLIAHDDERQEAATTARAAVQDRTFEANAARLLRLVEAL